MKKILLISATAFEIAPFLTAKNETNNTTFDHIDVLITGVGQLQTTFALTKKLCITQYDLVIQAGIAGSFDHSTILGEVVEVASEILYDLCIQDKDGSEIDFFDAGFLNANANPFSDKKLFPVVHPTHKTNLRQVKSITVNKVHGEAKAIESAINAHHPDIENMEGAALFYVCTMLNVPCIQLRAISNFVEPRNREAWNIPLAVKTLNDFLMNKLS